MQGDEFPEGKVKKDSLGQIPWGGDAIRALFVSFRFPQREYAPLGMEFHELDLTSWAAAFLVCLPHWRVNLQRLVIRGSSGGFYQEPCRT